MSKENESYEERKNKVTFFQPAHLDLYDWGGEQLEPSLRNHVTQGNVVRVQAQYPKKQWEVVYVEITQTSEDLVTGIVLDTYRNFFEGETIYLANGEKVSFHRSCILEIPLDWDSNRQLIPFAKYSGKKRIITGGITDNEMFL